ncbi:hypothetical protein O181_060669 [Austropuccinia psidii MF-1]|uniref:Reverse transcriptase domain-containing protein n=1 Tax=Austropuccinia psidii MF-1 TaxID=1389203 RepID=A0A9Q3EGS9_9BASI|nr:hypothetical protein [Austropuccinia psidii MF-1]
MGQALLTEVPKLKEWPHFSGEGEYDHMEFLIAYRWYIKLRQAHGHQIWTWWKTQIINKWGNDAWEFKVESAFESAKLNSDKDKALPWFCQQKDRFTALYPDISEFIIHSKIVRQCGGALEHAVKSRTAEQCSAGDIINILEEVTTRNRIGSSRVNLKAGFNTPWKDLVDKNPKENSNNMKYKSADIIRKCHICQRTTHLANACPKRAKINEIDIEKDDNIIGEIPDDKSSIFWESSIDIKKINATFEIMKSYSHLPQLSNGQLDLSKIQDAQLMKTKSNRGKGYTDDQLLPIYGIDFNSASNPMKASGICETTVIFSHINGNLRITVEFVVMENCSSTHFLLGNDYLIMKITVRKVPPINLELERFKSEQISEAEISIHLTDKQENELSSLLYDHKEAFESYKETLGEIIGHEVDIILNIERPYPPLLRKNAYPESPKSREALEIHINNLLDLGMIRKVFHNEGVEITTPVIVAWHTEKSRMVGNFRVLNTYTDPDRYPIPKIQIALTQISQAVYIATMDVLKGFNKNVVTPRARKYLRIIVHCGVYRYSRMTCGIKNAPSHFQRMMNEIFPEEL